MKLLIKSILFCSISFLWSTTLYTQSLCEELQLPQEEVVLHLDRNVCLAGETIWFKAWCFLDGSLDEELSKVLYVEIFDENQKAIVQQKHLLENNKTTGSIRIPDDVPSKYYFLKAYTRYMRNFSSTDFHYQQITIVNPLIEGSTIQTKLSDDLEKKPIEKLIPNRPTQTANKAIQIKLNKDKFLPRQQINFQVESLGAITAELSATVRLQGLGNQPSQKVIHQNPWLMVSCQEDPYCQQYSLTQISEKEKIDSPAQKKELTQGVNELQWLPETRGLTISGLVQNQEKENVESALTMVSILQKKPLLYMGSTNKEGTFTISLHHLRDQKDIFIGTPSEDNKVLIRNDFDTDYPKLNAVPLQYDSTLHSLFEALNLHQQLDRVYPKNKTQAVFQRSQINTASINIVAPDRRVVLNDFVKLPTMSDVFREITPGVLLQKKAGKDNLSVFDFESETWFDAPLVLLDNVPVFNIEELLKIDPAKVEAIQIHHSDYILGDYTFGAIISISTFTDNFAGYQWGEQVAFTAYVGLSTPKVFNHIIHQENSHLPDFRPVLYWQPQLMLNQQNVSETISLFAPDRPGKYEVLVQGYTSTGEPCLGYITFEVVQNM